LIDAQQQIRTKSCYRHWESQKSCNLQHTSVWQEGVALDPHWQVTTNGF